ncbi:MAG: DNA translocase FtsK 4TM domain-containing protein [Syntrophobacteraceae bacterium]|nr:DNA translocase FtsK 4TM domain-containing protein [Syntrophobacteraceae bacterium]
MNSKKQDILGLCLTVAALLVLFSLISFHPSDPTVFLDAGSSDRPRNWVGSFGANLAWALWSTLGVGAFAIVVGGMWGAWVLFRNRWPHPLFWSHICGLALLVVSMVSLLSLHFPTLLVQGQEVASGGSFGTGLARSLAATLYSTGTHVLLAGILLAGLVLLAPVPLQSLLCRMLAMAWSPLRCAGKGASLFTMFWGRARRDAEPAESLPVKRARKKPPEASVEVLPADLPVIHGKKRLKEPPPIPELPPPPEGTYALPPLDILDAYEPDRSKPDERKLEDNARALEEKLADFGVQGKVTGILPGPVITMYEYAPAPGIKISRIVGLSDDLAMALKAVSLRVVAPIPGKAAIGIELPNSRRQLVSMRAVLAAEVFASSPAPLTLALGQDITGQPVSANLARMPHLLIAGATGTGKSVCINSLLGSLIFRNTPEDLRLLLIDPKRIELGTYEGIPHLIHPVVTDAKVATRALRWAVEEMELRYKLLADKGARSIEAYNRAILREKLKSDQESTASADESVLPHHRLPFVVVVIDELADLMMVASREVEESITRLAQMARAAGIHLILATQRPSVDVLTGIIKANIPTRISFQVSSRIDSRTILDTQGAESLLGAGDMLFLPPGTAKLQRIHGAFVSDSEVQRLTDFWRAQRITEDPLRNRVSFEENGSGTDPAPEEIDARYQDAIDIVLETRQASISMLQRRLRVGYNRAARMIELMEQQGIVSTSDGVKPREVIGRRP